MILLSFSLTNNIDCHLTVMQTSNHYDILISILSDLVHFDFDSLNRGCGTTRIQFLISDLANQRSETDQNLLDVSRIVSDIAFIYP